MKRTVLFLLSLLLLVGCQQTPEQPLIVPKEQQLMVEKATATQAPEAEYTMPEAPDHWTFTAENKNFTYAIDADVYVPEGPGPRGSIRRQSTGSFACSARAKPSTRPESIPRRTLKNSLRTTMRSWRRGRASTAI